MSRALFCLHGFLGEARDWSLALPESAGWDTVHAADWLRDPAISGERDLGEPGLGELGQRVNRWARSVGEGRRVLVGYSMGGRIALHALLAQPGLWEGAVIISAHPGLASEGERQTRLEQDRAWARRFRSEDWDSLISAWNAQPVFSSEPAPLGRPLPRPLARDDAPGLREKLARALEIGSLGKQLDLRAELARAEKPVLWLAGEKDAKYLSIARECARLSPRFRFAAIPGGGHRAPWTANLAFQEILENWMNSTLTKEEAAS